MNDLQVIIDEFGSLDRYRECPPFWTSTPEAVQAALDRLPGAAVKTIGRSAGGREILAIEYGAFEPLDVTTDNLHSAIAAKVVPPDPTEIFPASFYGSRRRTKPAVVLQGGIHGGEITGTVGMINLAAVIETGRDLRGKEWPALAELARGTRLAMIPFLNIDGCARFPLSNPCGVPAELYERCNQGVARDGTHYRYPAVKNIFPVPPETTAFMGGYYNDAGANLQYDFHMPHRQPETVAWMEYYLHERPDGVVIAHGNAGSYLGPPDGYLPEGFQHEFSRLGGAVRRRLFLEGVENGRISWAGLVSMGKPLLMQGSAVYLVCGAMPMLTEFPVGSAIALFICDQMLDIVFFVYEEILFYAHMDGLWSYELWIKVKQRKG